MYGAGSQNTSAGESLRQRRTGLAPVPITDPVDRDAEICVLLDEGWTQQEIADEVGCATSTVFNARQRRQSA